jgi:hypothetical protein
MLPTDWAAPASSVLGRLSDGRVQQYWDLNHLLAAQMKKDARAPQPVQDCCVRSDILWDRAVIARGDAGIARRMGLPAGSAHARHAHPGAGRHADHRAAGLHPRVGPGHAQRPPPVVRERRTPLPIEQPARFRAAIDEFLRGVFRRAQRKLARRKEATERRTTARQRPRNRSTIGKNTSGRST